jgi:hypothetical protein
LFPLSPLSSSLITHFPTSTTMVPGIVWESFHSDGRPRNTPLPSTIHGWLTKIRGTLLDNETMRYRGIKEMKQAAAVRVHKQKEAAEIKRKNDARIKAGKPPLQPLARRPLILLSFMSSRPKLVAGVPRRPAPRTRKPSSTHTHGRRRTPHQHTSSSSRRTRRPQSSSKGPGRASRPLHPSKRSSKK